MRKTIKTFCLAVSGAGLFAAVAGAEPAAACDLTSATDLSCGAASLSPANPLSMTNPNNPANPASPFNPANPVNPQSIFNPINQARAAGVYDGGPGRGGSGGPYGYGLLSSLFGEDAAPQGVTPPDGYEPETYPAARHRQHHRHKRID